MSNAVSNFISMQKTKVLYISYDGLTDPLGQSQVLPYLLHLSELNYEITVLSTEKEDSFFKNRSIIEDICAQGGIKWEYIKYTKKPPVLSTVKDVFRLKQRAFQLQNKGNGFQIVHCRSYIAALVGLLMQQRFGVQFLFDMRGFWADERVDGGIWNLKIPVFKWVYNYFKKKEKQYLENADGIVSLTYNAQKELDARNLKTQTKEITVIPCCADLSHFDYNDHPHISSTKANLGISENNQVLCYLGSIGTWYMLEEMLDYFKIHLQKHPLCTFLWITKDDPISILKAAKIRGVDDKIVVQPAERAELPNLLSVCDASIFFIKPLYSKRASSPTKMAELLGMGIPLICNTGVGDTDGIVNAEQVGLVIDDFTDASYQTVADEFEQLVKIPKAHLRAVAKKHFSLEEGVRRYAALYKSLSD